MLQKYDHQKRLTVPGTLHGTINQITKSMFHAFVMAFYRPDYDFYIVTEDTSFGDFDDLIIITSQDTVTAIQYKHVKTVTHETSITINDVITSGGNHKELMFYKYYQSLFVQRPRWMNEPKLTFALASNSPIDENLACCIDPETRHFNDKFFATEATYPAFIGRLINASILKHNKKLLQQKPEQLQPYLEHLQWIIEIPEMRLSLVDKLLPIFLPYKRFKTDEEKFASIQQVIKDLLTVKRQLILTEWKKLLKLLDSNIFAYSGITHVDVILANAHPEKGLVSLFLQRLQFHYLEPGNDETIMQTKSLLQQTFKTGKDATDILYQHFFYYFMEWLGNENPTHITKVQIKMLFTEWQNRLLQLQQWVGISSAYQAKLVTTINDREIPCDNWLECIDRFRQSQKKAFILYGERGLGKSTVIYQYIRARRQFDSDYLMIDIHVIMQSLSSADPNTGCSFQFFSACQIIVVDNCEDTHNYSNELMGRFSHLITTAASNIQFIFLFRRQNFELNDKSTLFGLNKDALSIVPMQPLEKKTVTRNFPCTYPLFEPVKFTLYPKKTDNELLQRLACHPFYLNLLVRFYNKQGSFAIDFSSAENFIEVLLNTLLNASQLAVVRQLIYKVSQKKDTVSLGDVVNSPELANIITQEDGCYQFSHKLYEEWALRLVIDARLTTMIESNDDIIQIYQEIRRVLPLHHKEIYIYLGENQALLRYFDSSLSNASSHPNNNIHFLRALLITKNYRLLIECSAIFYVLVDSAPEELLSLLFDMTRLPQFKQYLKDRKFEEIFYTALIRGFCVSEKIGFTGRLFYNILKELDSIQSTKEDSMYYMENFFVNTFAGRYSMGMMSLQAKLNFLRTQCLSINPGTPMQELCYFQFVYDGLLKAASPESSGDASYPHHQCYFSNDYNNLDGYVDYKGRHFAFVGEPLRAQVDYHIEAVKILVDYYNRDPMSEILWKNTLSDLKTIFGINLASVTLNMETKLIYLIDVASIIVAEITLDENLLDYLEEETAYKIDQIVGAHQAPHSKEIDAIDSLFDRQTVYDLSRAQLEQIQTILKWRRENQYQVYKIPNRIALLSSEIEGVTREFSSISFAGTLSI